MDWAVRVSDAERDRALDQLRDAVAAGRLSDSTFIRRVDFTLRARTRAELRSVLADLPSLGLSLRTMLTRILPERPLEAPAVSDGMPALRLPRMAEHPIRIGRGLAAGLRIEDATVSRIHAELVNTAPGRWTLRDLDSTNGTFVNTIRLTGAAEITNGDLLSFGRPTYRTTLNP